MVTYSPLHAILPDKPNQRQFWRQLSGSAASLALYSAACQHDGLVIAITADMTGAIKLNYELRFYAHENQQLPILAFPDWEILPYDSFSPHQDIISERLATLYHLPLLTKGIVIVPINTLMHFICPRTYVESLSFVLQTKDLLDITSLQQRLESNGYRHVSQVMEHGEFSVRGSLIDLYPMGSSQPYRIDLFDNEVDSIRTFDPTTQLSMASVNEIRLLPAREIPLTTEVISHFRQAWRNRFSGNPALCPLYENATKGRYTSGIEYYLPLFFPEVHSLFDYFAPNSVLVQMGDVEKKATQFWQEVNERYQQLSHDTQKPILEPKDIILPVNDIYARMKQFPLVIIRNDASKHDIEFNCQLPLEFKIASKSAEPLQALDQYLQATQHRVLFCAETLGRREAMLNLLERSHIKPELVSSWKQFLDCSSPIALTVAPLDQGLTIDDPPICIITESQLFGQQVMQRRLRSRTAQNPENIIRDLAELQIGAPVVHLNHGVGRYTGLQIIKTGDLEAEYLTLEYSDGNKLYVPIASLHLISRYTGRDDELAPVYQLGSKKWEKIKQKTAERVRDVAAELLAIYAKRQARVGYAFAQPDEHYLTFEAEFPFEETPDQLKAINEVIQDMTTARPMDRLICGDVGFGKTEVAVRAAFLAAQDHKQVAVLVPTTLLAQQHYQTFKDRFASWPIHIAVISRFQSKKEQQEIIKGITDGKIDIVIGTHKLLQSDIKFAALGLLIIDEEHRFGVAQKKK